jgi:hypothetical protein
MTEFREFAVYHGLRCIGGRARDAWPIERRLRFLLDPDVRCPISLDKRVLPEATPETSRSEILDVYATVVTAPNLVRHAGWAAAAAEDRIAPIVEENSLNLGFDVCDEFGTSALMNCGYEPLERERIDGYWYFALNEYHLFARFPDADRFRELSDRRVSEHAPFSVIRLRACVPDL